VELKARMEDIQFQLSEAESAIKSHRSRLTSSDMASLQIYKPYPEEIKKLEATRQRLISDQKLVGGQIHLLDVSFRRLRLWLTIEGFGGFFAGFLAVTYSYMSSQFQQGMPLIYCYYLLIIAMVSFLPYLLVTLVRVKQYRWIVILGIMVGLPASLNLMSFNDSIYTLAAQLFPLLTFYVFCAILRWAVEEWIEF